MVRAVRLSVFSLVLCLSALVLTPSHRTRLYAQSASLGSVPQVFGPVGFALSEAVRDLPGVAPGGLNAGEIDGEDEPLREVKNRQLPKGGAADSEQRVDPAVQPDLPTVLSSTPAATLSTDGLSSQDNFNAFGGRVLPPDTNGDVGPNHYVQTVNLLFRVYNKSGAPLTPPTKMSSLFTPLGGVCSVNDNGDPIVLYDPLADRWLLSQFAFTAPSGLAPPYHQCVALSRTGDPTGSYFLYDFVMPNANFNDYPHFGVWPDGYYMTDNQFLNGGPFNGAGLFAFDRTKMLMGDPTASYIYITLPNDGGMLPADLDGLNPPPPGAPNLIAEFTSSLFGDPIDGMKIFEFHADFGNPAASTVTLRPESPIPVAAFDPRKPAGRNVIEQPAPALSTMYLDAIQDRLMFRLAYRNFGSHESLVVTHTVNVSGVAPTAPALHQAGVRYYEFQRSGGAFSVAEQATFAPGAGNGATGDNRWMGSAAQDANGNLAVGYSVSGTGTPPSIAYAGRLATDPPNGLFQGETTLVLGTGIQRSTSGRWGDYSALTVDPADDCTFWYTTEYYTLASQLTSTAGWLTRIGKFRFPSCVSPAQGTLTGTVVNLATGLPLAGAIVQLPNGVSRSTDATGQYAFALAPGSYDASATATNFSTDAAPGLSVSNGGTTTHNFAIAPIGADLAVALSAPAIVGAATDVTLTLQVKNNGPIAAPGVALSNPTPAHTLFVSATPSQGSCATPAPGGTGAINCALGLVPSGGSASLTLVVHGTDADGFIVDSASVTGAPPDVVAFNNTASSTTAVTCGASFTISGGPIGAALTNGVQIGRITRNGGPSACSVPKAFPGIFLAAGARKFDLYSLTNDGDVSTCVTVDVSGTCGVNAFAVAYFGGFNPANLAANYLADPGQSGNVSFAFPLAGGATASLVVHEVTPPVAACAYQLKVSGLPIKCAIADVTLSGSAPASVTAGTGLTYTFTATNPGTSPALNVVVNHQVPANTGFASLSVPAGWSCTTPAIGAGGTISCSNPSMGPGESAAISPTVSVNCPLLNGSVLSTSATVTSTTPDPNPFNNSASVSSTVTNPAPTITAPSAVTLGTEPGATSCSRIVPDGTLGAPTAAAFCGAVTVTRSGVPAGNEFPVGATTVTYTATDGAGNSATALQLVTIVDDTPPVISGASVDKPVLWPPNHKMIDVLVSYSTVDNCSPVTSSLSIASNEPINGGGDGNTSADWEVIDAHHVRVRAERAGGGNGRIYTITITAKDANVNARTQTVLVRVPHDNK